MFKKKIMFFLPALDVGGAERVTVNIIRYLNPNDYEIHLVMVSQKGLFLEHIPSYVTIHNLDVKKTMFSLFKLRKIIQKIEPTIIYSTLIRTHIALYLVLKGIGCQIKTVMRMPSSPKLMMSEGAEKLINKFILTKALKKADVVLAQTPEMKEEIEFYYGINRENVKVVINILDKDFINKSTQNQTNPFNSKRINVVASGLVRHIKGFDILILAFKKVYMQNKNFRLNIIGRDQDGQTLEYEKLILSLGLEGIVSFLGSQSNPYPYYFYSDLFVLSSRREGLPNVVLENLYLEKPVVATRCVHFMSTIIQEGVNGFLVDVNDVESLAMAIINFKEIKKPTLCLSDKYSRIEDIF
jgi:glycosyltransferase involved in cell wall biosynthesis